MPVFMRLAHDGLIETVKSLLMRLEPIIGYVFSRLAVLSREHGTELKRALAGDFITIGLPGDRVR